MHAPWRSDRTEAGEVVYPPGGTHGPRIQNTFQLVHIHSGWLRLTVDDGPVTYGAGTVLLLVPERRVYLEFANDGSTHHSWLAMGAEDLTDALVQELYASPRSIPMSRRMDWLVKEALTWTVSLQAAQVVPLICRHALYLYVSEAQPTPVERSGMHKAVGVVERFIRQHYAEEITLRDLAAVAAVTPEHLCRVFQAETGRSPMASLWAYRTDQALNLLSLTGLPVAAVAEQCGFKTPFHLYERVRAVTGHSPTRFRRRSRVGDAASDRP